MINIKKWPVLIQNAIDALRLLHNVPDELAIIIVLGVINFAVQSRANVDTEKYGVIPISLFLLGIMPSGGGKSTIYKELMVGINKYLDEQRLELEDESVRFAAAKRVFELEMKKYVADASSQGSFVGLQKPIEPMPINTCKYITKKGTANGIVELLKTQPMLGLFSSEGGEFFNSHSFQGGDKGITLAIELSSFLTSLWDGSEIDKITGMDQVDLRNRRVAMLLLLQETVIRSVLKNPIFADQGLMHRILITRCNFFVKPDMEDGVSTTALTQAQEDTIRQLLTGFHDRIYDLLNHPHFRKLGTYFELDLPTIKMTKAAKFRIASYYNQYNNLQKTGQSVFDDSIYAGFLHRVHEMPIRIAANFALFEQKPMIDIDDINIGIDLYEFFIEQRKNLNLDIAPKNEELVKMSQYFINWIKKHKFDDKVCVFKNRDIRGARKIGGVQFREILDEMASTGEVELYSVMVGGKVVEKIRGV